MKNQFLIERNPAVLSGKPIIKGTRISVELIIRKLSGGHTVEQLLESYPHLSRTQIMAVLDYAADVVANEDLILVA